MRKILILSIILLTGTVQLLAQHDNTLFFMDKVPQHHYMNPSLNPECRWWLGGAIVPIFGQLPPPMHVDINLPFDYNDFIYYGSGDYKDSLVTPLHPSEDINDFLNKLDDINYFTFEYQLTYLYFGFKAGQNTITFDLSDRNYTHVSIPKDIFTLALTGNATEEGRNSDISGLTMNQNYYREFALGFNRNLSKYFKVGLRGKFLMGIFNVYTSKSDIHINTEETTNVISAKANYSISTNMPVDEVTFDESGKFIEDVTFQDIAINDQDYIMNNFVWTKNYGWAIDAGFSKDWNSEITLYGSVVDFGFIQWNQNPNTFSLEGDSAFIYRGIELTSLDFDSLELIPDIDKIIEDNYISHSNAVYKTWLPLKIYAGLKYKFSKRFNVGLLGRFEKLDQKWLNAYTGSLNINMFKWGNISLSYSYNNKNWNNIGWGYTVRIGPAQWYIIGDNNIGVKFFPDNARNINYRFGCNLMFGRDSKKKDRLRNVPLLNTL